MAMAKDLQKKLKGRWESFTPSEQRLAGYLLQNLKSLPFETAASLGQRVGVSAMTVGRFLRKLGYAGVAEMSGDDLPARCLLIRREGRVKGSCDNY